MKSVRIILILVVAQFATHVAAAQEKEQMVRLAKLVIDSTQLETYKAFLKEEIETSLRVEPGVLTLYAVFERKKPDHLTILEIYKNVDAYKAHIQTPHFIKYKTGTLQMVKSLELTDAVPLLREAHVTQR